MTRPFYTEYVRHMLRFYTRNLSLTLFKNKADELNWHSCHDVFQTYSNRDKDILTYIYAGYDTLADNVYEASLKHNVNQNIIWDMMKEFEQKIAKRRELL